MAMFLLDNVPSEEGILIPVVVYTKLFLFWKLYSSLAQLLKPKVNQKLLILSGYEPHQK